MDFDCIYKSYYLDVYHFLCGLSSNKEIAEDITQETFTKALTAINSYDGRKDIRAWLFTIARNTYFTYCKREKIYVEWEPPTEQVDIQTEFIDNLIIDITTTESIIFNCFFFMVKTIWIISQQINITKNKAKLNKSPLIRLYFLINTYIFKRDVSFFIQITYSQYINGIIPILNIRSKYDE